MNRRFLALIAASSSLAVSACAHEQVAPDTSGFTYAEPQMAAAPGEIRRYADQDNDGRVTRAEAEADPALVRNFDNYDLDDNDALDRGEFARLEAQSHARRARGVTEPPLDPAEPSPAARGASLNRTGVDRVRPDTAQD